MVIINTAVLFGCVVVPEVDLAVYEGIGEEVERDERLCYCCSFR